MVNQRQSEVQPPMVQSQALMQAAITAATTFADLVAQHFSRQPIVGDDPDLILLHDFGPVTENERALITQLRIGYPRYDSDGGETANGSRRG